MATYIIGLDQGTTSSRAVLYHIDGTEAFSAQRNFSTHYPKPGFVEQQGEEIWNSISLVLEEVISKTSPEDKLFIGITNQRETLLVWDRKTLTPLAPAIVWQCRRSATICKKLKEEGRESEIRKKTGLVLDPYFSGSKAQWLLENVPELEKQVRSTKAVFGTVDSWLLSKLTNGRSFFTEPSNASRTMLFSLESRKWDEELLQLFKVPEHALAQIKPSASLFGITQCLGREIPITGILGDQQAALFGNHCFQKNSAKITFGTGAFLLGNTGAEIRTSSEGLLTTVAWSLGNTPQDTAFALEGSIFIAGALIQWLRDQLGIITNAAETEERAKLVKDSNGVILVPAFVGLGAPHWDDTARGAFFGLTRDTHANHIILAALEAVAHQVADLLEGSDLRALHSLQIDGGMSENRLFCQILADLTRRDVEVSPQKEMTAFGAASIAALGGGLFSSKEELSKKFNLKKGAKSSHFSPQLPISEQKKNRSLWREAIKRVRAWS